MDEQQKKSLTEIAGAVRFMRAYFISLVMLALPLLLVFLLIRQIPSGFDAGSTAEAAGSAALAYLASLPTHPAFYYLLALLVGLVAAWRSLAQARLTRLDVECRDGQSTSQLSLRVAYTQRRRAFALRTGAIFLLGGVVSLLAGGLYLIIFVLPQLNVYDVGVASRAALEERYGEALNLLVAGRYWLSVPHEFATSSDTLQDQTLAFSKDGKLGLAAVGRSAREQKPILVTTDRGRSWSLKRGLELDRGEWLGTVEFGESGKALALGNKGTAFRRDDGGESWKRSAARVALVNGDWVNNSWYRPKDTTVLALGHRGTVQSTSDWGETWKTPKWRDELVHDAVRDDSISETAFSADGTTGVIGRYKSSIRVLTEGNMWREFNPQELGKQRFWNSEWLNAAAFSKDGEFGVMAGVSGSVYVSTNGGKLWSRASGVEHADGEGWVAVSLSEGGNNGVLVGTKGSVFVTNDSGNSWIRSEVLNLRKGESVHNTRTVAFSADAMHGVLVGTAGSVFVTVDGGNHWRSTARFDTDYGFGAVASIAPERPGEPYSAVALDAGGNLYLLRPHDDLKGWSDWPSSELAERLRTSPERRHSALVADVQEFRFARSTAATGNAPASLGGRDQRLDNALGDFLSPVNFLRVFTLTILFFLVALFVRLYQYNLRLAAFWESRSDAVLLADRLAHLDSKSFGELVSALSPDSYDFKPGPRSASENTTRWLWRKRDS